MVDDNDVKKYLLKNSVLSEASMWTYKISRPYQLKACVHSLMFNSVTPESPFCVIRGRCNPSQSTNEDDVKLVHVILDNITGEPCGGYCTCTVG